MTLDQKLDLLIKQNEMILQFVTPKVMSGSLVGSLQAQPEPPDAAETSANPGKYFLTPFDPMKGYAPVTDVIDLFSEKRYDAELGHDVSISGFVGGTLYEWARRDMKAFLSWYQFTRGHRLNLDGLTTTQKAMIGIG